MTGQDILDRMELINQELQLQAGEPDVTRGLLALNMAQDIFETVMAAYPDVLGGSDGTILTVEDQEYSLVPTGLLRLDALDYLDPTSLKPVWPVIRAHQTGGQAWVVGRVHGFDTESSGKPQVYWSNGSKIFWYPTPDDIHSVRYYGFKAADALTAGGTFAYPDVVAMPVAVLAARMLKTGIDDPTQNYQQLAQETFGPIIKTLSNFNRDDSAAPFRYKFHHGT